MEIDPLPNGSSSIAATTPETASTKPTSITVASHPATKRSNPITGPSRKRSLPTSQASLTWLNPTKSPTIRHFESHFPCFPFARHQTQVGRGESNGEPASAEELVDIDVFQEAKKVIDGLRNQEAGPALAWCADNKSRLKKSKSKFEFQEFVELVRAENNMRSISYARKYLSPWGATHMKELQRVMATLVVRSHTECAKYKINLIPPLN
ncbi:LisH/CRA/RING-U-box domains-containing protein isoform 3 [Hibiscus syriacus]|uniref:LisH/CRA/RING-U-box domains-containing protein isoform 3 n=1 Tax=Hibiscus syriacus TaxID=106335 RepID=A0A6A2X5G7_HIBSY|nr:LisH/CRA/RING-U-box domains-containing protein isoform 3 [Hibiscus syriacus]